MKGRLAVLAAAVLLVPAAPARADHVSKSCGAMAQGSSDYRVKARGVRCKFARKWTRAYLRRSRRPRGWSCFRPGTDVSFYCRKGSRSYWAERL